jgi:hypothetical protein
VDIGDRGFNDIEVRGRECISWPAGEVKKRDAGDDDYWRQTDGGRYAHRGTLEVSRER